MIYLGYIVLAGLVVFLSLKLANYVDLLDKTTNISGAFIGGIFLAAVTSLPELFTSISSVAFVHENGLVLGNILGSNLFNLMILAFAILFFTKKFVAAKLSKAHFYTSIGALACYGIIFILLFVNDATKWMIGWFNVLSLVILAIYALVIIKTPQNEESDEKMESSLTTKQIIIRFIICAVILVGASIGITFLSDMIAEAIGLTAGVAGALLLGIATSLPELTSTMALCAKGNFNASTGNIVGSNMFNFAILFVADMFAFGGGELNNIYVRSNDSNMLLIFGTIATVIAIGLLIYKKFNKSQNKVLNITLSSIFAVSIITCYALFLVFSV